MSYYPYMPNNYFPLSGATDLPALAAVLDTDTLNGVAGTYHAPSVAEVQEGITFGPSSSLTGTYSSDTSGDGTLFGDAASAILNSDLGYAATYTATGVDPVSTRVLLYQDYFPELGVEGHTIAIDGLPSVFGSAVPGETVTVAGTTYKIKGPPQKIDKDFVRLELSID